MRDIFVSYRRSDSEPVTERICDHLKRHFGEDRLFKDVDAIDPGSDFRVALGKAIAHCKVFVAVVGPRWLTVAAADGRRRLDDPEDTVRNEVRAALERGVPIVPVLVEGAQPLSASDLPAELDDLAFRHAIQVRRDPDFAADVSRLSEHLCSFVEAGQFNRVIRLARRPSLVAIAVALIAALVAAVVLMMSRPSISPEELARLEDAVSRLSQPTDATSRNIAETTVASDSDPYHQGLALLRFGRIEDALKQFQAAEGRSNYSQLLRAKIAYYQANCLYFLGRNEEALQHYDRALTLKTDFSQAKINRGIVLDTLGRRAEALDAYAGRD